MSYSDKLRDPRWQKKRLEVMQRDKFSCCHCGASDKTLNVHHAFYVKNRDVWDYPMFSLVTLCEDCHVSAGLPKDPDEDTSQKEFESTMDMFFAGRQTSVLSPAIWEIACVRNQLLNTVGVSEFDVDSFIMEGLLRLWKQHRTDSPPIWMGQKENPSPWITPWVEQNFRGKC